MWYLHEEPIITHSAAAHIDAATWQTSQLHSMQPVNRPRYHAMPNPILAPSKFSLPRSRMRRPSIRPLNPLF